MAEEIHQTFGNLVSNNRNYKKLTQEELGKKVGLHRVTIAKIENGQMKSLLETAIKIANYLEFSLQEVQVKHPYNDLAKEMSTLEDSVIKKDIENILESIRGKKT